MTMRLVRHRFQLCDVQTMFKFVGSSFGIRSSEMGCPSDEGTKLSRKAVTWADKPRVCLL
jgi:hypothetical protein